jgi:hypothetical protein
MKALSIKQPWAWLICAGYKDIENRDWSIIRRPGFSGSLKGWALELPSRIYVHAGRSLDTEGLNYLTGMILPGTDKLPYSDNYVLGAIVGEVDIVDCVTESKSPWFVGKYGFVLKNPKLYEHPIPCRGALGFFEPELKDEVS